MTNFSHESLEHESVTLLRDHFTLLFPERSKDRQRKREGWKDKKRKREEEDKDKDKDKGKNVDTSSKQRQEYFRPTPATKFSGTQSSRKNRRTNEFQVGNHGKYT